MTLRLRRSARLATVCAAAAAVAIAPALTATASATPSTPTTIQASQPAAPADGTPEGAIQWFESRLGDASMEGLCEKAVENAYGTTGVWPSAIAHWNGAIEWGKAHPGDWNPPRGAFVYWNTSQYGHVGIADGNGGFYSTSVNGAIGHSGDLSYFGNYLGWSDAQVPAFAAAH